jgi:hypothetical protein
LPSLYFSDEIDDPQYLEFAIENFSEMMGYIAQGNLNILD